MLQKAFTKSHFQISTRMHPGIHFWNTSSFSVYCLQMDLMVSYRIKTPKKGGVAEAQANIRVVPKKADFEFIIIISVEFFSKNYGVNHSNTVRH